MKGIYKYFPFITLCTGGLGFALYLQFISNVDRKGLLPASDPAATIVFILTAVTMAILLLGARSLPKEIPYAEVFCGSMIGGFGCFFAAVGVLLTSIWELAAGNDPLASVCLVAGILASAGFIYGGICRMRQRTPSVFVFGAVCVYMVIHLICQYRAWSPNPQPQSYCFQLFASVMLMLTAYYRTAHSDSKGDLRWLMFCNYAALFFCCVALCSDSITFYLPMALWVGLDCPNIPKASEKAEELPHEASE